MAACFAPCNDELDHERVIDATAAAAYSAGKGSLSVGTTKSYLGLLDYLEEGLVAVNMVSQIGKVELGVVSHTPVLIVTTNGC